ncbi:MAG TPA: imidazole glycerol phosphate synthase subunit HisH [Chloroflexota bacterium]|nr:imidazole glycerol phosphate synthase subunit HisH [Chloroflexota bacterium]
MDHEAGHPRIVIVDYGAGNLRSVARALVAAGAQPIISSAPTDLESADGIVLPGVGAAAAAMHGLARHGLIGPLRTAIAAGRPFLGICLGLQVLMSWSDEGGVPCLGIMPGRVRRLPAGLTIPHMGWNQVHQIAQHWIFQDIPDNANFYFVHSYVVVPEDDRIVLATTDYGGPFVSAVGDRNIVATQFHPEKSGSIGLRLYRNFVRRVTETRASAMAAVGE